MDGCQLAKLILATQSAWKNILKKDDNIHRAFKSRSTCPVVAITASKDDSTKTLAEKAGIKKVLYKPVDIELL